MSNDDKQLKATVELLLNNAKNRDAASHSLGFLFPKIQNFLGGFGGNFTREDAVLQRRISHRDVAPFYFDFGTQGINWGRVELENVLRSEDPARVLSDAMKKIAESPASDGIRLRRQLLEALENGFKNRTPQLTIDWFNAVVRESPHFLRAKDFAPQFLHRVSNDDRLRWALYRPMQEMSAGERANLLAGSIDVADDISLLCDLFRSMAGDTVSDGARREQGEFVFGEETGRLRSRLVDRVRLMASENQLWSQVVPMNLLWYWRGSGFESDVKQFTRESMFNATTIRFVLELPVTEVLSTAGNYEQVQSAWDKIVDLELLRPGRAS